MIHSLESNRQKLPKQTILQRGRSRGRAGSRCRRFRV